MADGDGEVAVRLDGSEVRVPVEVTRAKAPRQVSFRNEIVPVLTKLGCNQGACHGSQHGKGGFKLSLLGFEPESDYTSIVKSAEQRRVTPVCAGGEPDPAQAHAGRGPRRRQAARAGLGALSAADALARAGRAGPARRRPAGGRPEGLSRAPADGARTRAAASR